MLIPITQNSSSQPPSPTVIDYAPSPAIDPARRRLGKFIVIAILLFMTFSWTWNLAHAVIRDRLSIYEGLQFVISIYLMIYLWRGSPIARWVVFTIYALAGTGLVIFSIENHAPYFTITGSTLILLATLLALPSVTAFQRHQRQSRT